VIAPALRARPAPSRMMIVREIVDVFVSFTDWEGKLGCVCGGQKG
jgi:hypothetical protein